MPEKTKSLEKTAQKTPEASSPTRVPASCISPSGSSIAAIPAAGNQAIQRAAGKESSLNFSSDAPVNVRGDPDAVMFLRRNQAAAATLDASTIAVDPAYRDSRTVLSHEYAHIVQLRSGRTASREESERAAANFAFGAQTDVGGAASPPLFQPLADVVNANDPLGKEAEARGAAEIRDLPKFGAPQAGFTTKVDVGAEQTKLDLGRRNVFHADVIAAGENGGATSSTDFTVHIDSEQRFGTIDVGPATKPAAGTIITMEGQQQADWALAERVKLYPVVLRYERRFQLADRDGRTCYVTANSTIQFSYETWARVTSGQTPSLATLQSLTGDTGFSGLVLSGAGALQKYEVMAVSEARSIDAALFEIQMNLEQSQSLQDAAGLPKSFVRPDQTAGAQFETLEAILKQLDDKELERRAKLRVIDLTGRDSDDDLPAWSRGIMSTLEKALLVITLALAAVAIIVLLPFEISLGLAIAWVGLTLLATAFVSSLISRIKEASREGIRNPASILSASILDTIGAGPLYEGITNRSLLSNRDLNLSEEERWESGSAGVLGLIMSALGLRSSVKSYYKTPDLEPFAPRIEQAADVEHNVTGPRTPSNFGSRRVDASRFNTPEEYLDAIRDTSTADTVAGQSWDHTRFPNGPRRVWQPMDPVDMPSSDGTYPTFGTARPRFWRNRAGVELDARALGMRERIPNSSDVISSMSDAELVALRDTPTRSVTSPVDPITGRTTEIEHFGVPQRAGGWLEDAGFSASDARRLSGVANPENLLDLSPPEHAFFDAEAWGFGRQRADPWGNMWSDTPISDPRVGRPLYFMSDAAITEIVTRSQGQGINLTASPNLLAALRGEITARGLLLVLP